MSIGSEAARIMTAVAADASVPCSSTSMSAWWTTASISSCSSVVMPEKSALVA